MHILVTGSNGQLGMELQKVATNYPQHQFIYTDIDELDISLSKALHEFFNHQQFDVVINCAAFTAVDRCETEKELARKVNALSVKNLAKESALRNFKLIHISTDYVYDGKAHLPYKETDFTNPNSAYGMSKLEGEELIEEFARTAIIIRTSWLYSAYGNNFVKTILKHAAEKPELRVVFDQIGTPTYAGDLAEVILLHLDGFDFMNGVHLFNYSNEGVCSWYDFAKEIVDIKGLPCLIKPILTQDYPLPAPRPAYCVLDKSKIKEEAGIVIPHWKDSLKKCLKDL